jgi:putative flippase GtrA
VTDSQGGGIDDQHTPPPSPVSRTERSRLISYLAIGFLSLGVDFGLLVIFRQIEGAPVWLAGTLGYSASVVVNYGLNRVVSFGDRTVGRASVVRYGILLGLNWATTVFLLDLAQSLGVIYLLGKVLAVGMLAVVNFVLYSRWVFAT